MGLAVSPTAVILVIRSFGQNDSELSKSSTIYKYLIFIYSEQMTHSEMKMTILTLTTLTT